MRADQLAAAPARSPCRGRSPSGPPPGPVGRRRPGPRLRARRRAMPMTSRSSERSATICCFSMARRTLVSRSRRRAARSNSSASAASCISCSSRPTTSSVSPVEERQQLLDERVVVVVVDLADARARRTSRCGRAGTACPAVRGAGACCPSRCGSGTCAAAGRGSHGWRRRGRRGRSPAHALAGATPHDHGPGPVVVEGDGQERVALVVDQPDVEAGPVLLDQAVLQHERLDVVADLDPLDRLGRRHHLRRAGMHRRRRSGSSCSAGTAAIWPCPRRSRVRRRP